MNLIAFVVNTSDLIFDPKTNGLMKIRLRPCLCICMSLLFVSCASVNEETYLTNNSLSGIKKVAIIASANDPDLTSASIGYTPGAAFLALLIPVVGPAAVGGAMLAGNAIESAARSSADSANAKVIGTKVDLSSIEDKIVQSFTAPLTKASCFDRIDYLKDKNSNDRQLSDAGYDAVIRLDIKNISFVSVGGDNVNLRIRLQGQLTNLRSRKVMWDRLEYIESREYHTLDYYQTNGPKELNALLEKAGQILAYDFVYLK